jgi:hypothetical protein
MTFELFNQFKKHHTSFTASDRGDCLIAGQRAQRMGDVMIDHDSIPSPIRRKHLI